MRFSLLPLCCLLLFASCGDDAATDRPSIEVRLTDSPGDYEKVIVDVIGVEVRMEEDFVDLDESYGGSYDLLELTNGIDTLIAASELPAGKLQEVRLLLGDDNFVQIDGEIIALSTPSAQQSGLKVKVEDGTLEPGGSYRLLLDFDAGRSVVEAGNSGKYNLKPVLRATLHALEADLTGRIGGIVEPAEQQWVIAYPASGDTLGTYADTTGAFMLMDVPTGVYTVEVIPSDTAAYGPKVITGVSVTDGELTNVGTVNLN